MQEVTELERVGVIALIGAPFVNVNAEVEYEKLKEVDVPVVPISVTFTGAEAGKALVVLDKTIFCNP